MRITDPRTGQEAQVADFSGYVAAIGAVFSEHCGHKHRELRRWTNRNGSIGIHEQCLDCGMRMGPAQKAAGNEGLPAADPGLEARYIAARNQARDDVVIRFIDGSAAFLAERRARYLEYRKTPEWKARRAKVMKRCGGVCEGCGETPATQVHHLTYDHLFDELLFELVGVCADCHAKAHAVEGAPEHLDAA